ncbi:RagB/SusD family nutrient uptake outer membrane protein [Ilyomonas limi]|uniref:RagB/SusD family nutrient uptake outer membrane protein n=1 Tax=Ilyomonas limi TaxID=2575867 RepID=A0A4U3L9Z8_9BACT|nr:RagB/SusD family nutrient uptake outer membrane protein [Ilyomonas limi]TKK71970.1 RagB/SusD family nutrient uptake outer membrane protein [Ilyomonas limi]
MNYRKIYFLLIAAASVLTMASCSKKLDRLPNNGIYADSVYNTLGGYKQSLAKVYAAFALTGSNGPGTTDLAGIDAGLSDFVRMYWNVQELASDEAVCAWITDANGAILELNTMNWSANDAILTGLYNRCFYQITVANSFIRSATPDAVAKNGITGANADEIKHYVAEARFLRAYQYWVLMDLFGNPPFVTENDAIGSFLPKQISRDSLFTYVESELKAIEPDLIDARANEYGRADKGADWALLARLYLNAEVYTGTARYADAAMYAKKVIDAGYQLKSNYKDLFLADNNVNNPEVILSVNYDALRTQNYGGTTFIVNSSINSDMVPSSFGVPAGGWGGNRAKPTLPNLFGNLSDSTDTRAMFFGDIKDVTAMNQFTDGLRVTKFKNINSDGSTPPDAGVFCSTDFPLFRLGEVYLEYAEALLRTGDATRALTAFNAVRERAYGNTSGNLTTLTLDDIMDERGRELYWEGYRRTDLIRFGKYTAGNYLWQWKGGVKDGTAVASYLQLYPIPSTDMVSNTNLIQNPGY